MLTYLLKIKSQIKYVNNFINTCSFNLVLALILLPTRISKTSTLTDNIFSNSTSLEQTESGNVTLRCSDHLAEFNFLSDFFSKIPVKV